MALLESLLKISVYMFAPLMLAACVSRPVPPVEPVAAEIAAPAPDCSAESFSIYFEEGATTLSEESDAVMDAVSASYSRCDLYKMEIEGHADASGDSATNEVISAKRADAVLAALETRGVDAQRVHLVAYGDQGAIKTGGVEAPLNRKTEVRLIPES